MVRSRTWPAAELAAWLRALGDGAGLAGHSRHVSGLVEGRAADCRCVDAKTDTGRALARVRFQGLPEGLGAAELEAYRGSVEVPCRPYYAYEEYLAVFGDAPGIGARSCRPSSGSPP